MEYNLSYSFMTALEIKQRSAALINKNAGVRFLDVSQAEGSLCDRRLGPVTQDERCLTCSCPYITCKGHFGHIELALPVIPPFTLPYIVKEYKKIHKGKKITVVNNELIIHNKDAENTIVTAFDLLKEDYDKWDKYVLQYMVVLATNKRPYTPYKKGEYRADYLTQLYAKILACNSDKTYSDLKKAINAFYELSSVKQGKNLHDRIDGKFGRVKSNIIGSRVNYTARAVVTCDPTLKLDQVGVPSSFCDKLTIPDFVFADNINTIKKNIKKYKYYQVKGTQEKLDLKYYALEKDEIQPGDILHRPLESGDWVVMNRQPTLHPNSMLAFRVVRRNGVKTFSFCLSVCKGFNLDFDGDEMNMHVPQTLEARIDCEEILNIKNNMLSFQSGNVITGLIYDAVLGVYELTKIRGKNEQVIFDERMVGDICCSLDIWGVVKGKKTAREMMHLILPPTYYLPPFPLKNKDINTIIKELHMDFGKEEAYVFLNGIQVITNHWMKGRGYSTGMMDGYDATAKSPVVVVDVEKVNNMKSEREKLIYLNSIRDQFNVPFDNGNNCLIQMITAGSKGSAINFVQLANVAGQQTLDGKRLGTDVFSGGFIASNFFNGLTAKEMFVLARCARGNMAHTAIQTPEAGYLAKQFYQMLENVIFQYDGTVRRYNDIIQLKYGGDNLKAQYANSKITEKTIHQLFLLSDKSVLLSDEEQIKETERYREEAVIYKYLTDNFQYPFSADFFNRLEKRINDAYVEPGTNVGVIAAECVSEPATQMSLDSFHHTGQDTMETYGLQRIKELVHCTEKEIFVRTTHPLTPQLLVKDCFDIFVGVKQPLWELRYLACFPAPSPLPVKYELRQKRFMTLEQMKKITEMFKGKITHSNYYHEALTIRIDENISDVLIDGVRGILSKKGNDYVITDVNTYKYILSLDGRATTNSVKLMYHTFGIAATYQFLCNEFKRVMSNDNYIDPRHYQLLASTMCYSGMPRSTKTLDLTERSPMSRAAYQRSLNMFIRAAFQEEVEENKSVSSKLAMGYRLDSCLLRVVEDQTKKKVIEAISNKKNKYNLLEHLIRQPEWIAPEMVL